MISKINNNNRKGSLFAKLISLSFIIYTLAFSVACSDFLEIKSQSEIVLEDFWSEKADVDNIVAGCYSRLQASDCIHRMIVWGEARSENVMAGTNINNNIDLQNVLKENITTKNSFTAWDCFYNVINRCNTVIKYAPGVAESDPGYTQGELKATIAEVSALRDLCYFYLIRTFRNVPYSTVAYTDDDQVMDLPPTKFEDVLDSLITDLESVKSQAIRRYPTTKPLYQTGRITQDAIYAMLCEMYLWKKDYAKCKEYADLIIESKRELLKEQLGTSFSGGSFGSTSSSNDSRFNNFPLISDQISGKFFGNAYQELFGQGNTQETIFELIYDDDAAGAGMIANTTISSLYGSSDKGRGFLAPSTAVINDVAASSQRSIFDDSNKKMDARMWENLDNEEGYINKFVYRSVTVDASNSTPKATRSSNQSFDRNSSNWIIYRLTDIMLLKAEALAQELLEGSDDDVVAHNAPILQEAFWLVNAVNKRSVCEYPLIDTLVAANYNSKSRMEELVMRERQRELMFEGKRWYDLVRRSMRDGNTDVITAAASKRESINSQYVQSFFGSKTNGMYAIFWPYNDEETKVNLNLAAAQNPAFGNGESSIKK